MAQAIQNTTRPSPASNEYINDADKPASNQDMDLGRKVGWLESKANDMSYISDEVSKLQEEDAERIRHLGNVQADMQSCSDPELQEKLRTLELGRVVLKAKIEFGQMLHSHLKEENRSFGDEMAAGTKARRAANEGETSNGTAGSEQQ